MSELVASSVSLVGNVREHNEDSCLVDTDKRIFIVADGVGGHAAGEVASRTAVERAFEHWSSVTIERRIAAYAARGGAEARRNLLSAVREGVVIAHRDIMLQSQADPSKARMGTTFTGFIVAGGEAVFAHAGDSRAHLYRDGILMQLSEDHTVSAAMQAAGVAQEEIDSRRERNMLTNALGQGASTRVAMFLVQLYPGDKFLLSSDGVYSYFDELELGEILGSTPSPALAANKLVDLAIERGGADNATAVVVKVVDAEETIVPARQRDLDNEAIESCALFANLTLPQRLRALRITTPREFKDNKEMPGISTGTRVAYIVLAGAVGAPRGKKLGPGDVIYPDALLPDTQWDPQRFCDTHGIVRALVIRRDDFIELSVDDAELGVELHENLAELLRPA